MFLRYIGFCIVSTSVSFSYVFADIKNSNVDSGLIFNFSVVKNYGMD